MRRTDSRGCLQCDDDDYGPLTMSQLHSLPILAFGSVVRNNAAKTDQRRQRARIAGKHCMMFQDADGLSPRIAHIVR